jgi:hypothetical protein
MELLAPLVIGFLTAIAGLVFVYCYFLKRKEIKK